MELRQLEAFVAVSTELHFGRAAEKLRIGQPTLSDLIRRLERELGAPLLTRTTRKVALTGAGQELLGRAKVILDEVAAASAAVRRTAQGEIGTVRVAITPPVAPVLMPHLQAAAHRVPARRRRGRAADVAARPRPGAGRGHRDVAITCARLPETPGVVSTVFCSEPLLVGFRPGHRLADRDEVDLRDLQRDRLGVSNDALFPAWNLAQRQALDSVGVTLPWSPWRPRTSSASGWTNQAEATWILLTASLGTPPGTIVPVHHPGVGRSLHPAVEPRTGPDRRGRPFRQTGLDARRPVRMAFRPGASATPRLIPCPIDGNALPLFIDPADQCPNELALFR